MKEAIILVGPSGAGKSTFAKERQMCNPDFLIISRDAFREALIPNHKDTWYIRKDSYKLEKLVTEMVLTAIRNSPKNIIIDETNLNKDRLKLLEEYLIENGYTVVYNTIGKGLSKDELKRRVIKRDGNIDVSYIDKQISIFEEISENK